MWSLGVISISISHKSSPPVQVIEASKKANAYEFISSFEVCILLNIVQCLCVSVCVCVCVCACAYV